MTAFSFLEVFARSKVDIETIAVWGWQAVGSRVGSFGSINAVAVNSPPAVVMRTEDLVAFVDFSD